MANVVVSGIPQLERRLAAIDPRTGGSAFMQRLGLSTVREAKLLVPRRTGNLGRSIHISSLSPQSVTVEASAGYAAFVEMGTRPHEITPRTKLALRFAASPGGARLSGTPRSGAPVVFAKRVHHPGTRPHPYLLPGAEAAVAKSGLADEIVARWNGAA
jgi:hypothetical protein